MSASTRFQLGDDAFTVVDDLKGGDAALAQAGDADVTCLSVEGSRCDPLGKTANV